MKRRLFKRERAKRDIIGLADYIARDNFSASSRFLDAVEAAFRLLARTPGAGAKRVDLNPAFTSLRMWPVNGFEKHLIFCRETACGIEIIRVLHSARDISALFQDEDPEI